MAVSLFPQDIYKEHLSVIRGVSFTPREIDVLSCLLHVRGTRKISSLLSISPNTVLAHARNIMLKTECNSREGIIDFIERSRKLSFLREYYLSLVVEANFQKLLKIIARLNKSPKSKQILVYWTSPTLKDTLICHLKKHLSQAGLSVEITEFCPQGVVESTTFTLVFQCLTENSRKLSQHNPEFIDLTEQDNYYIAVCDILKKLLPHIDLIGPLASFMEQYESLCASSQGSLAKGHQVEAIKRNNLKKALSFMYHRRWYLLLVLGLGGVIFIGVYLFKGYTQLSVFTYPKEARIFGIRSSLILPTQAILLPHSEEIAQINEKLKGQGVQTLAIIGPGGAGKTILARQYVHQQEASIIWEINAATPETLRSSFEHLGRILAKTPTDQKCIRTLHEIHDPTEREKELVNFIKTHLKLYPNWFLIYDNVRKFSDIKSYFPYDAATWGYGKVILTTRNTTIQNNSFVNSTLHVAPLTSAQKYFLFSKIIGESLEAHHLKEEARKFLEKIPSFPLDVTIAAYYLKSTNISCKKYLEKIEKNNKNFVALQEILLREFGDYTHTRYGIIALSAQRLIEINKDFTVPLLLISLLDAQDIPRDLFNQYKDGELIDSFIYHLKKYSLITTPPDIFSSQKLTFSIHRSTQAILLSYLTRSLNLKDDADSIHTVSNLLEIYMNQAIEEEDLPKMSFLIPHAKSFLGHKSLLPREAQNAIAAKLGCIYYYTHYHKIARQVLERAIKELSRSTNNQNYKRTAQALVYLGNAYKEVGEYKKSCSLLKKSRDLYIAYDASNYLGLSRTQTSLADVYKNLGNHSKAREILEENLAFAQKHLDPHHIEIARIMLYLGIVYRDIGEYTKAVTLLQDSLSLFNKYFPENYTSLARALKYLGNTYRSLGRYEEAKTLLHQSLLICDKHLPDNQIALGRSLAHLATIYKNLGDYKTALRLLEKSLELHNKIFGTSHVRTQWVTVDLANIYREYGDFEQAKALTEQSYPIYERVYGKPNLKTSWVSLQLGYIYEDTSEYIKAKGLLEEALKIHKQHHLASHIKIGEILSHLGNIYRGLGECNKARDLLEKSLRIYENHYGKDHIETARVIENIGKVLMCEGRLDEAEAKFKEALTSFQRKNHPKSFLVLEALANLHLEQAKKEEEKNGASQGIQSLKGQAIKELEQALEIAQSHLPKTSAYLRRLQDLLQSTKASYTKMNIAPLPQVPFYFVRHGETEWNREKKVMGHIDIPLSCGGVEQARQLLPLLKNLGIERIVVSPLQRARETANIIGAYLNLSPEINAGLSEICWGDWQGKTIADGYNFDKWAAGYTPQGAESCKAFQKRILETVSDIIASPKKTLIVAHNGVYWALMHTLGYPNCNAHNCRPYFFKPQQDATFPWYIFSLEDNESSGTETKDASQLQQVRP